MLVTRTKTDCWQNGGGGKMSYLSSSLIFLDFHFKSSNSNHMVAILSSDSAFTYNTAEIIKNSSQIEIVHAFSDFDSLFSFDDESSPIIILLVHIPNDTKAFQRHLSKIKVGTEVALVYKTNPYKNLEIPSTNLSFNLLTENKLVLELPLAIACMRMGSKFVGSYFNNGFKKMRPLSNSPSSFLNFQ